MFFSGYLEYPKWNVPLQKANHEGAVDFETFTEVQRILTAGRRAGFASRGTDFPARGFVCCADCNGHLTSGWSHGKLKEYPYYKCFYKSCESYGKPIPRTDIEDGISVLLNGLKPTKGTPLEVFRRFVLEAAESQHLASKFRQKELRSAITSNEKKESQLIDRVLDLTEKRIIDKLQERVVALGRERELLQLKLKKTEGDGDVRRDHFEHLG